MLNDNRHGDGWVLVDLKTTMVKALGKIRLKGVALTEENFFNREAIAMSLGNSIAVINV